eukprot:4207227-Lingulodinium_polyedra.AAC.1
MEQASRCSLPSSMLKHSIRTWTRELQRARFAPLRGWQPPRRLPHQRAICFCHEDLTTFSWQTNAVDTHHARR